MEFEDILKAEAEKEEGKKEVVTRFPSMPSQIPTGLQKFDTRAVMADLKALENNGTALVNEANALVIKTPAQNMEAVNISGRLQELIKQIKKKCEDFLEPYKKVTSAINGPKKRVTDAATRAKTIVNQKILQFKKHEEIEQAKQQKLIDEASKKLQKSLNEQAKEIGIEAPKIAPIKAPTPVKILRGDTGAAVYTRKGWKCEIIDPAEVPRMYCVPSQTLLNQAVKMGNRLIRGCRIYEDETPVTRSA